MRKIICITTYPPRECGIATFAQDLIRAILSKFGESYSITDLYGRRRVCS